MWDSLLALPSFGYGVVVRGRNLLYDRGILKAQRASVPVVSIGNLEVGGTGKTPLTLLLAKRLGVEMRVGIVSRGYRGEAEKKPPQRVFAGCPARVCGDEVALLAARLPEAIVVVGRDRVAGAALAAQEGAQVVLLDDGMQHRRLERAIEIVVIDDDPREGHYLPWGRLRDEPRRLAQADVIVTQGEIYGGLSAPIVQVKHVPSAVEGTLGKKVGLFCGVGRPQRFVETAKELGVEVVATLFGRDHQKMGARALQRFARQAQEKGAESLLCTEKDAVKGLPHTPLPIGWVKSTFEIQTNHQAWEELIQKIREHVA